MSPRYPKINEAKIYYIGSAEGHEYPDLQVGDEVNPRLFFGLKSLVKWQFFQSVGNVTVDTIKHYKKGFQMKPNAELQLCGPRGFWQRRLHDFWIPANAGVRPEAYPVL